MIYRSFIVILLGFKFTSFFVTPVLATEQPQVLSSGIGSYLSAQHAQRLKAFYTASDFIEHSLKQDPQSHKLINQAFLLFIISGRYEEAFKLVSCLEEEHKNQPSFLNAFVAQEIQKNSFVTAEQYLEKIPSTNLNSLLKTIGLTWIKGYSTTTPQENPEDIPIPFNLSLLPRWVDESKALSILSYHRGLLYLNTAEPQKAQENFSLSVTESGDSQKIVFRLVSLLRQNNYPDIAQKIMDHYYSQDIDTLFQDPSFFPSHIEISPLQGYAEVLLDVAQLTERFSSFWSLFYTQLAKMINPTSSYVTFQIASTLQSTNQYEDSFSTFQILTENPVLKWQARLESARNLYFLERTEESIMTFYELLEEYPEYTLASLYLGRILTELKRLEEAIVVYNDAFNSDLLEESMLIRLHYRRAIAYHQAGDWLSAEYDLQAVLRIQPDHVGALNYLGYTWADDHINLEQARTMIAKALQQNEQSAAIIDSMGWVLYRLGDLEGAVFYLERAVSYSPSDPEINEHLGDVYWDIGRRYEAQFQWQRVLNTLLKTQDPSEHQETIQRVRQKLQESLED